jgi:hypothetical protein
MSRSDSLRLPGRLLETQGDLRRRGMVVRRPRATTEPGLQIFSVGFCLLRVGVWDGGAYRGHGATTEMVVANAQQQNAAPSPGDGILLAATRDHSRTAAGRA